MRILLLTDKLGVTAGYEQHWNSMLAGAGIPQHLVTTLSIWRAPSLSGLTFLTRKGNRKSPGFNPEVAVSARLRAWVESAIESVHPVLILCSDIALLGLVEESWDIATIDNLRGGIYDFSGIPWLVIQPISAINTSKKPKDIRIMNNGAESADEFEEQEHEDEEFFVEPYTYPYGKRVLAADLQKAARIYRRIQNE